MKKSFLNYNNNLKKIAQKLRKKSTLSEVILWRYLKGKQRLGFDFHRQKPINKYIVDFYCPKLMLTIEIDGISHEGKEENDHFRQSFLEEFGVKFIRFSDDDVKHKIEYVVKIIDNWIVKHTPKSPLKRGL